MAVVVRFTNKSYIELKDEYDPESVWKKIREGVAIPLDSWGNETTVINPGTVTTVQKRRETI